MHSLFVLFLLFLFRIQFTHVNHTHRQSRSNTQEAYAVFSGLGMLLYWLLRRLPRFRVCACVTQAGDSGLFWCILVTFRQRCLRTSWGYDLRLLLVNFSIFSMQISAFVLVCGRVLVEAS